jgi:thioesterase domain-containing protein
MHDELLIELQQTIEQQIPMCASMGIHVHGDGETGLVLRAPLDRNRNRQQTAFAGSLNALCTVAGWGMVYLITRRDGNFGDIVIRRSSIKYLRPVDSEQILATCAPVAQPDLDHFLEMLRSKGQAKLELRAEVLCDGDLAVAFSGSYVVLGT